MNKTVFAAIVLAAGRGTRMKSRGPKVLHKVAGLSMVGHVLSSLKAAGTQETVLVTAPDQDEVRAAAMELMPGLLCAVQEQQLGTGDAVKAARPHLSDGQHPVVVLCGDTPLLTTQTLAGLIETANSQCDIAVLGFRAGDPTGYGRLLLDDDGFLREIREHADASLEERAVNLCNSGVIAFRSAGLLDLLDRIGHDNAKNEYYLTDIIAVAQADGLKASVVKCAEDEVVGVNSRAQLARAEVLMQHRLRLSAMDAGVTLISPETVYLSTDTRIGEDVTIEPHVVIGPGVTIGAGAYIHAFSHLERAEIAEDAIIGPYARLRPGARIGPGAKIGNFVEIKNAEIETGAKVNHLSYVGDARVGAGANVGAGTITCNYDGFAKHVTDIGAGAFIGSNSALVAPVRIGDGAYVGSGSVISKDVEANALAVTRAPQLQRANWAERKRTAQARSQDNPGDAKKKRA